MNAHPRCTFTCQLGCKRDGRKIVLEFLWLNFSSSRRGGCGLDLFTTK